MKSITQSQIDVIKFLLCENEEANRNKIITNVGSVMNAPALRKVIDLNKKICSFVTIRDMNEKDQYKKQVQIGYSLKNDSETLIFLLEHVYTNEDISDLMNSTYYQNMIPEIIDHFDTELQKQNLTPLTQFDRKQLTLYLKHTSSGLRFIFNPQRYEQAFNVFESSENVKKQIIKDCSEIVLKSLKVNGHRPNKMKQELDKASDHVLGRILEDCKNDALFRQFSYHDAFLIDVDQTSFNADMDIAVTNFNNYINDIATKIKKGKVVM